jgi:hypothetical protein
MVIIVYSITNKDITVYNRNGTCLLVTSESIDAVMKKYKFKNPEIQITL